jgi:hypothetical protein
MNPLIAAMIRASGRSWWQARYFSGRVVSEWDTAFSKVLFPIVLASKTSRWEEVEKKGMVGLRLLCPNGMCGELEAPEGFRFFQLKSGGIGVGIGFTGPAEKVTRYCDAHIIGVVEDTEGNCLCRAWETQNRQLIEFRDNIFNMQYRHIGRLSLDVQQLKV